MEKYLQVKITKKKKKKEDSTLKCFNRRSKIDNINNYKPILREICEITETQIKYKKMV